MLSGERTAAHICEAGRQDQTAALHQAGRSIQTSARSGSLGQGARLLQEANKSVRLRLRSQVKEPGAAVAWSTSPASGRKTPDLKPPGSSGALRCGPQPALSQPARLRAWSSALRSHWHCTRDLRCGFFALGTRRLRLPTRLNPLPALTRRSGRIPAEPYPPGHLFGCSPGRLLKSSLEIPIESNRM